MADIWTDSLDAAVERGIYVTNMLGEDDSFGDIASAVCDNVAKRKSAASDMR